MHLPPPSSSPSSSWFAVVSRSPHLGIKRSELVHFVCRPWAATPTPTPTNNALHLVVVAHSVHQLPFGPRVRALCSSRRVFRRVAVSPRPLPRCLATFSGHFTPQRVPNSDLGAEQRTAVEVVPPKHALVQLGAQAVVHLRQVRVQLEQPADHLHMPLHVKCEVGRGFGLLGEAGFLQRQAQHALHQILAHDTLLFRDLPRQRSRLCEPFLFLSDFVRFGANVCRFLLNAICDVVL
mmetsp:Transcript_3862/g.7539  ORF Transcript_3862/g.7539 Transcript_3862/m.7539 type:complete len:236 (-) Transcript_3862:229-936(-)